MLPVLDLDPMFLQAAAIRLVAMLGDQTLSAGLAE